MLLLSSGGCRRDPRGMSGAVCPGSRCSRSVFRTGRGETGMQGRGSLGVFLGVQRPLRRGRWRLGRIAIGYNGVS
jgi:hypothetical protein